jgi:hypothetical protein
MGQLDLHCAPGALGRRSFMRSAACAGLWAAVALALAGLTGTGGPQAAEAKYPNWKGQWDAINPRFGGQGVKFDPTKAFGPAQQAPLTSEYHKVHEESMADQAQGGQGNFIDHARCIPGGMPSMMSGTQELIITPETTYISAGTDLRRIFTDGRPWPADAEPTYQGYSIGKWIDTAGSGTYDTLEVETRGPFKGPRAYDATGLPLAFDNESTFKELFHLDKNDPNILHNEITVFDHALTRPWSVDKTYRRNPNPYPQFARVSCMEGTNYVVVGKEVYFLSGDGFLMPTKRDQAPPDPRYFRKTSK